MEHAPIATLRQRSSRQSRDLGKSGATLEHAVIAIIRQRSSRQSRSLCEASATVEHAGITTIRQRGSRKSRSLCETGATVEHLIITTHRQRGRRKSRSLCETGATVEHVGITTLHQRRMLSGLNSCIIKKILDIADTCNISTSKNPFISLTWAIVTETSNHYISSTSQIQNILTVIVDCGESSGSIPSRPGSRIRRILQSTSPMLSCVVYCQSKAIR